MGIVGPHEVLDLSKGASALPVEQDVDDPRTPSPSEKATVVEPAPPRSQTRSRPQTQNTNVLQPAPKHADRLSDADHCRVVGPQSPPSTKRT